MQPERWHEVERIYLDALEYVLEERAQFVVTACQGDEELRREVEELLAHEERSKKFIEVSALEIASREESAILSGDDRAGEFRLAIGSRLGPYEILKGLGAGGMGEIYRARDTRLGRIVALKIVSGIIFGQESMRNRLKSEAQAISRLNHPNICTLHDIGSDQGSDYLVMEYLEGQTLAQRLKRGSLPGEEMLRTAIEICGALDYAHRNGVVHRDLKPGNLMLTDRGAKLLDFGLARWREEAEELTSMPPGGGVISSLTLTGFVLGTPQYMAPEQIQRRKLDARTDIFALGAVMYEMATGRKAFEGETSSEITRAILSGQPRELIGEPKLLPAGLRKIISRCLQKNPEDRWQSAGEVANELSALKRDTIPNAPRGRRRWLWVAVSAFLILASVAAIFVLRSLRATVGDDIEFRQDLRPEILHSFDQQDGDAPYAGVVADRSGVLYGTTHDGGPGGGGTVYALAPPVAPARAWTITVLYSFSGGADGCEPQGVVVAKSGELYGTTRIGGVFGNGTVFRVKPPTWPGGRWTETVLHSFTRQNGDGAEPLSTLVMDRTGALYGTTQAGGSIGGGNGVAFRLNPPRKPDGPWTEEILFRFGEPEGGSNPWADLLIGDRGELFGTTFDGSAGIGVVFKLEPPDSARSTWKEVVLHHFTTEHGDGDNSAAGLVAGANGTFYGTTTLGVPGLGSVFELRPPVTPGGPWSQTVLHHFSGTNGDGSDAATGLVIGKDGGLYGTTLRGGRFGKGTIFHLRRPSTAGGRWKETVLYTFTGKNGDGVGPKSMPRLLLDSSGILYGTTIGGGASNAGTVFRLKLK